MDGLVIVKGIEWSERMDNGDQRPEALFSAGQ
jgi:hypothetical protein